MNPRRWVYFAPLAIAIIIGPSVIASSVSAESSDSKVFSPDSNPYGMDYKEWTTKWWTWFVSSPTDVNPINDPTGERCAENQSGPAWFLVGSGGGKAVRSCTIPAGKAILIPNIIIECSYAEDQSLKTVKDLETCATEGIDITTDVWTTIDGKDLPDTEVYRVKSDPWNFTFPDNNVFSAPAGPTQAVSDGYWTFIKPLPPGNHTIHVGGLQVDYTVTTPTNFLEDSTYNLVVQAGGSIQDQVVSIKGQQVNLAINSTSSIADFVFNENSKDVTFTVNENGSSGMLDISIGSVLNGPYAVSIDGKTISDFKTEKQDTGEDKLLMTYDPGIHEITIVGTSVVPEFPVPALAAIMGVIGLVVIITRIKGRLI